jgi:hypothetical protein
VVIKKWYKDEHRFDGSKLLACIIIVNQEQAFKAVVQMKINGGWSKAKLNLDWVNDEEINRDD